MVFWCFPPTIKCEWSDLRSFVDQYNATYGTSYTRKACLDVEIRDRRAPELLLESPGKIPVVIERKSVVWPSDYMSSHRNEHRLFEEVPRALADAFEDGAYKLTVRADYLKGKSRTDVRNLVDQITHEVLSDRTSARMRCGIRGSGPIPWSFRPLGSYDLDGSEPTTTIGVSVLEPGSSTTHLEMWKRAPRPRPASRRSLRGLWKTLLRNSKSILTASKYFSCNFTGMTHSFWMRI